MMKIDSEIPIERLLRRRFDAAAAKSLAVLNPDDAEPEMARFLHLVQKHIGHRPFVVDLFVESFGDSYYLRGAPWEFLQFCMHSLCWTEIQEFIIARRDDDVNRHGARSSTVWNDILGAFDPSWSGASEFREYARDRSRIALARE